MTKGISWPVESMVLTPWMLFQRIVVSMLTINPAMLRTTPMFHAMQKPVSRVGLVRGQPGKGTAGTALGAALTSCFSILLTSSPLCSGVGVPAVASHVSPAFPSPATPRP